MRVCDDVESSPEGDGGDCYRLGVIPWAEGELSYSLSLYLSYYCVVSSGISFRVCSLQGYFVVSIGGDRRLFIILSERLRLGCGGSDVGWSRTALSGTQVR